MSVNSSFEPKFAAFEKRLSNVESGLSAASGCLPVLGIIPAIFKVAMGSIQLIAATFGTIATSRSSNQTLHKHCVEHIKHGIGNISAGLVEGIPVVGSFVFIIRKSNSLESTDYGAILNARNFKFYAYSSMENRG